MSEATAFDLFAHPVPFIVKTRTAKALHFAPEAIQSRMSLADPNALDLEYTRLMMGFLLFNPRPARIVMIGLGGGSLPKFCHRHLPYARIDVAEANPLVIALRDEFHIPRDSSRFQVVQADGAQLVRDRVDSIDVLLVDGFDDLGQPPQLASHSFYDDCRESLTEEGVMVVNLHHAHDLSSPCVERFRQSFRDRMFLVYSAVDRNMIAFAFKGTQIFNRPESQFLRPAELFERGLKPLRSAFASIECAFGERNSRSP